MSDALLTGALVRLRPAARTDIPALVRIRQTPEVFEHWRGGGDRDSGERSESERGSPSNEPGTDMHAAVEEDFAEEGIHPYVVLDGDTVVGWIQWSAEEEPDYRFAGIDIYLAPQVHGRGLGTDAMRTLIRHLIDDHGHRRFEIDPAATNAAAIRCYTKVGFRPVGVRRESERGNDGTWHDALLMDLLASEFDR